MISIKQESECCCCFSKEDLFSMLEPYNYEETSEIYATMIAECFQTETKASIQEYYRHLFMICKKCVFGLRDAIVLRSQIQIAYNRIQKLLACHTTDSDKYTKNCDIKSNDPIECSNVETEENIQNLNISKCDSTGECCCCFSKEDLFSMLEPYNHKETFEIYATMIAECFQIETKASIQEYSRNLYVICKSCVFRLRYAIVLRSQIQIAYNRIQELLAYHVVEMHEYKFNPDIKSNDPVIDPIQCSDVETKENKWNLHISESHSRDVDSVAPFSNKNVIKLKSLKIIIEKLDINKIGGIMVNSTKVRFKNHAVLNSNVKGIKCEFCEKVYTYRKRLLEHMKVHSNPQKYTCKHCDKIFPGTASLLIHEKFHLNIKDFICDYCGKEFIRKRSLRSHILAHLYGEMKCEFCGKKFTLMRSLMKHMKMHSNPQKYTCKHCNKIVSSTSSLLTHEKIHLNIKDFICDYCNKKFRSKNELKNHILAHLYGKSNKCEFCEKTYLFKAGLRNHMKTHSDPEKHTCKHCNKIFSSTLSLLTHEKIHLNIKDFICNYCNKECRTKSSLKNHLLTHTAEKVKCEFCEKVYASRKSLLTHVKTHFNLQKYTCKHCDKIFSTTASLLLHEKTHLNIKDLTCSYCNKECRTIGGLKYHQLTHSAEKIKCEFCEKVFASRKALSKHVKTHSNLQKYTCKYCHKVFSKIATVLTHEKIHLDIKDIMCDYCNKEFRSKDALKRHIVQHSNQQTS